MIIAQVSENQSVSGVTTIFLTQCNTSPSHLQLVTCPVSMLAMQELGCFQELCTDPCNMRWWSWMNGTTMGLRILSRYLCAFKMPSIKWTCVLCP